MAVTLKLCTPGNESEPDITITTPQTTGREDIYSKIPVPIGTAVDTASGSSLLMYSGIKWKWNLKWNLTAKSSWTTLYNLWYWSITNGSHLRFYDEDTAWYNVVFDPTNPEPMPRSAPAGFDPIMWNFMIQLRER